jgi:hypothetical protein
VNRPACSFLRAIKRAVTPSAAHENTVALLAGGWADKTSAERVRANLGWHTLSVLPGQAPDEARDDQTVEGGLANVRCSAGAFSAAMLTAEAGAPISNRHNAVIASGHMLADQGVLVAIAESQALAGQEGNRLIEILLRKTAIVACGATPGFAIMVFRKSGGNRAIVQADIDAFRADLSAATRRMKIYETAQAPPVPAGARVEAATVSKAWARERAGATALWRPDGSFPGQADPPETVKPLMPLRKGHLALAIAGGVFGTIEMKTHAEHLLVKGQHAKRTWIERHAEEGRPRVSREMFSFRLGVLDCKRKIWDVLT